MTLTTPQSNMLDMIDTVFVRQNRMRDGWIIDSRKATAAESRVITSLQEKQLVKWERTTREISGYGAKVTFRLVRK